MFLIVWHHHDTTISSTTELRLVDLVPDAKLNVSDLSLQQKISLVLGTKKLSYFTDWVKWLKIVHYGIKIIIMDIKKNVSQNIKAKFDWYSE